jgi:hypothetical protein
MLFFEPHAATSNDIDPMLVCLSGGVINPAGATEVRATIGATNDLCLERLKRTVKESRSQREATRLRRWKKE